MDRPRKYIPVGLERALNLLEEDSRNRFLELEKKRFLLMDEWIKIPDFHMHEKLYTFRLIQGSSNVLRFLNVLYDSAEREIDALVKGGTLINAEIDGVDDLLKKCVNRDVRIRHITEIDGPNIFSAKRFLEFSDIRHIICGNLAQMAIVDDGEVLIGLSRDLDHPSGKIENAIWTNHPELIATMKSYFEIIWETAKDGQKRIKEIENASEKRIS